MKGQRLGAVQLGLHAAWLHLHRGAFYGCQAFCESSGPHESMCSYHAECILTVIAFVANIQRRELATRCCLGPCSRSFSSAQGSAGALHAVSYRLYILLTHHTCPDNAFWGAIDRAWASARCCVANRPDARFSTWVALLHKIRTKSINIS